VSNPDMQLDGAAFLRTLEEAVGAPWVSAIDAAAIARRFGDDAIGANTFLIGFAWQKGLIPLARASLLAALDLNGVAVAMNRAAFESGRIAAEDPSRVTPPLAQASQRERTPAEAIRFYAQYLAQHQNDAYAARYLASVRLVEEAEKLAAPESDALTGAFARSLFKLMAYKDEYEVARLYADPAFARELAETFEGDFRLTYHLAPPFSRGRQANAGPPRKREFGAWMAVAFRVLAKIKFLRGTLFDPFGHTDERRMERKLITDFEAEVRRRCQDLTRDRLSGLVRFAQSPLQIRGYGHLKRASADSVRRQWMSFETDA
jgi:indolepyruvate ferredoxin oxidoreductase